MSVRPTMATLILRVRSLIGDPAGGSEQFADQDIQDALDETRITVRQALLRAEVTINPGGGWAYTDYYANVNFWEDDILLQNGAWNTLTPATTDNLTGHWTFANVGSGQLPPVFVTGKYFDVWGAAADLLDRWAAVWLRSYDFTSDGQSFRRSQAAQAMRGQAAEYRKKAMPKSVRLERDDLGSDNEGMTNIIGISDVFGW